MPTETIAMLVEPKQEIDTDMDWSPERPITPLTPIKNNATVTEYLAWVKSGLNAKPSKSSLKKTILGLLESRQALWMSGSIKSYEDKWQLLGVELFERTGDVVSVADLRSVLKSAKSVLRQKIKQCVQKNLNRNQTYKFLLGWECFRHFQYYYSTLGKYEDELRAQMIVYKYPEESDDDIICDGFYYKTKRVEDFDQTRNISFLSVRSENSFLQEDAAPEEEMPFHDNFTQTDDYSQGPHSVDSRDSIESSSSPDVSQHRQSPIDEEMPEHVVAPALADLESDTATANSGIDTVIPEHEGNTVTAEPEVGTLIVPQGIAPVLSDRAAAPAVTDQEIAWALPDRAAAPTITDEEIAPVPSDNGTATAIRDEEIAPIPSYNRTPPVIADQGITPVLPDHETSLVIGTQRTVPVIAEQESPPLRTTSGLSNMSNTDTSSSVSDIQESHEDDAELAAEYFACEYRKVLSKPNSNIPMIRMAVSKILLALEQRNHTSIEEFFGELGLEEQQIRERNERRASQNTNI